MAVHPPTEPFEVKMSESPILTKVLRVQLIHGLRNGKAVFNLVVPVNLMLASSSQFEINLPPDMATAGEQDVIGVIADVLEFLPLLYGPITCKLILRSVRGRDRYLRDVPRVPLDDTVDWYVFLRDLPAVTDLHIEAH